MMSRNRMHFLLASLLLTAGLATAQGTGLPAGFQEETVVAGLSGPTALAFAPDGRLFLLEKAGTVRVFKGGQLLPAPFLQLSVTANSERGLLGIAFDPAFATNGYVYLYYTTSGASTKNRVARFTASGDVGLPESEAILIDAIPSDAGNHNGGCLRFGLDGKLYASTGDGGATPSNSQNLGSLAGKILRVNPDGTIPPDNPFLGQAGRRGEIYCYGLRNPWRFCFRPGTNTPFIADVGQNTWEEVNVGTPGGNYGWPTHEGPSTAAGFISPLYAYNHNGSGASISGGCFINGGNYPAEYQGAYFFGDYVQNFLARLAVSADNTQAQAFSFGPAPGPVDFAQGPDGDLYYVSISTGSVRRIRWVSAANRPPVAQASASPTAGPLPLTVNFSSAGSSDPDGDPLGYLWNFGDGGTSTLANPSHTYATAGTFSATLQVNDGRGGTATSSPIQIRAGNRPPDVRITGPADESLYRAGDTVLYGGSATDPEEGALPASRYRWTVLFYHADHTHPFLETTGVTSGSFAIPRDGEPSADTWYEIRLAAADSDGAEGTAVVQIRPRTVNLTFKTSPKRLMVTINGQPQATPVTIRSVVGFDHRVGAPDQQKGRAAYVWRSWSDGGAQEHTLRAPESSATYTATFRRKR